MSKTMPSNIAKISDAAIEYAYGRVEKPQNIDDLYHWLFWKSDNAALDDFEFFFSLDELDLNDSELMFAKDLPSKSLITDAMRIAYARVKIKHHATESEELGAAHAFKLKNKKGEITYACCIVQIHGQGGQHPYWIGLFSSKEEYYNHLKSKLKLYDTRFLENISDAKILAAWKSM